MKQAAPLVALGEVATFIGGSTPSRKNSDYFGGGIAWVKTTDLNNGVISRTEESISLLGLHTSSCKIVPKGAVLVAMYGGFNQIGRTGVLAKDSAINQALTAIVPNADKLDSQFLLEWLNYRVEYWKRFAGSSRKDPNITKDDVRAFPIRLPPLSQQLHIRTFLQCWNQAIETTEALIEAKQKRNRDVFRKLLFGAIRLGKRSTTGQIKTKWFSAPDDWRVVRIGLIAKEVNRRNGNGSEIPVLSCTKHQGLVDSLEYFDRQIYSKDTSAYKVVEYGEFAYATNHIEEGSIGYQDLYPKGLVSPMYTVFKANRQKINDGYLYKLLKTETFRHIFEINTSASVDRRGSLRWKEFSALPVPLPTLGEQAEINEMLGTAEKEVVLLRNHLELLKRQKRGLMQKLLTGRIRLSDKGESSEKEEHY